jgi:hypothetical protein
VEERDFHGLASEPGEHLEDDSIPGNGKRGDDEVVQPDFEHTSALAIVYSGTTIATKNENLLAPCGRG